MKNRWIALACACASTATAQVGSYLGPGVLSRGAGEIGNRSGQQVDLRFYASVTGVYDSEIQPFSLDSKGRLLEVKGLYGVEATLGAYGSHRWRRASLGLDYQGSFYHYSSNSFYDGSNHGLTLGYTYQKSRRLSFDLRQMAGTSSRALGGPGFYGGYAPLFGNVVIRPATLLFDNRTYYTQSTMDVNFAQTPRTTYTFGGDGYAVRRQARGLVGVNGYDLHGSIQHRLTRTRTIGAQYEHLHFDFPPAFGESDVNTAEGVFSEMFGRRWTFSLHAGVFVAQVQGLQQVKLDPVIAALLGQGTTLQTFYRASIYPSGGVTLSRSFKTSSIGLSYSRTVNPGNGLYLTSRSEEAAASYSYTGVRKWNFGATAGYTTLSSVGQGIQPYSQFSGGAGFTYGVTHSLHIIGRYDARHQAIDQYGYRRSSSLAALGLAFSPGDIPLSLW